MRKVTTVAKVGSSQKYKTFRFKNQHIMTDRCNNGTYKLYNTEKLSLSIYNQLKVKIGFNQAWWPHGLNCRRHLDVDYSVDYYYELVNYKHEFQIVYQIFKWQ